MLTQEQKSDIVKFITHWSTKSIFESVDSIGQANDELDYEPDEDAREALWEDVRNFLVECGKKLKQQFNVKE